MTSRPRVRSRTTVVLWSLCVLSIGLIVALLLTRPRVPSVPIPSPNAADTLDEAGSLVTGLAALQGEKSIEQLEDAEALRRFLVENEAAFSLYVAALKQECVPVVDYEKGITDAMEGKSLTLVRRATSLARVSAQLAELEGRPNDAAKQYADLFTVGAKYGRDGLLVHTLVGFAFERMGLQGILELADSLDESTKAQVLQIIESTPHTARDFETIAERERVLQNNEHGALPSMFIRFMTRSALNAPFESSKDSDAEILALQEKLIMQLQP